MVNTIFLKNITIIMMVSKGDGISIHHTNGEFGWRENRRDRKYRIKNNFCHCLVRIKSRKDFGGVYAFF